MAHLWMLTLVQLVTFLANRPSFCQTPPSFGSYSQAGNQPVNKAVTAMNVAHVKQVLRHALTKFLNTQKNAGQNVVSKRQNTPANFSQKQNKAAGFPNEQIRVKTFVAVQQKSPVSYVPGHHGKLIMSTSNKQMPPEMLDRNQHIRSLLSRTPHVAASQRARATYTNVAPEPHGNAKALANIRDAGTQRKQNNIPEYRGSMRNNQKNNFASNVNNIQHFTRGNIPTRVNPMRTQTPNFGQIPPMINPFPSTGNSNNNAQPRPDVNPLTRIRASNNQNQLSSATTGNSFQRFRMNQRIPYIPPRLTGREPVARRTPGTEPEARVGRISPQPESMSKAQTQNRYGMAIPMPAAIGNIQTNTNAQNLPPYRLDKAQSISISDRIRMANQGRLPVHTLDAMSHTSRDSKQPLPNHNIGGGNLKPRLPVYAGSVTSNPLSIGNAERFNRLNSYFDPPKNVRVVTPPPDFVKAPNEILLVNQAMPVARRQRPRNPNFSLNNAQVPSEANFNGFNRQPTLGEYINNVSPPNSANDGKIMQNVGFVGLPERFPNTVANNQIPRFVAGPNMIHPANLQNNIFGDQQKYINAPPNSARARISEKSGVINANERHIAPGAMWRIPVKHIGRLNAPPGPRNMANFSAVGNFADVRHNIFRNIPREIPRLSPIDPTNSAIGAKNPLPPFIPHFPMMVINNPVYLPGTMQPEPLGVETAATGESSPRPSQPYMPQRQYYAWLDSMLPLSTTRDPTISTKTSSSRTTTGSFLDQLYFDYGAGGYFNLYG